MAKTTNVTISIEGETPRVQVLDARLSGLKELITTETARHGHVQLTFDDFSSFRKHPKKLKLLENKDVSFSFDNFKKLNSMNLGFIHTALTVGKHEERNSAISRTLKDKKAKGKTVGNDKIGDVRKYAIRHRSNNALKLTNLPGKGSAVSLAQLVINYIDGKRWSFNRLANFLSDARNRAKLSFVTGTRKFYPNTIKDIYNRNQRYFEMTQPANMNGISPILHLPENGRTVRGLDIIEETVGLKRGQSFDDVLTFPVPFVKGKPFVLKIIEAELQQFKADYTPYETVDFGAGTHEVWVDLDERAVLPGAYLLSIEVEGEKANVLEDFPVVLRDHLVAHLDPTVIEAEQES